MTRRLLSILVGVGLLGGVGLLVLLAGDPRVGRLLLDQRRPDVLVRGDVGGEKIEFLRNPDVVRVLQDGYGVRVDPRRVGSLEMARSPSAGADFIWPAHETAADLFRALGRHPAGEANIFSTPIVVLSWTPVVRALEAQGYVARQDGTYYLLKLDALLADVRRSRPWAELGLPQLFGPVSVISTHPAQSNSGMMFAALAATVMNGGRTPTPDDMDRIGPDLRAMFERLGRMEDSSGKIFQQFLSQGMGAFPLMVAYENQLIEYYEAAPEAERQVIADRVRVLYPVPTTWASHPLLALNDNGRRLIEALQDPEIRRIAWTRHGFRRPGAPIAERPEAAAKLGMPADVGGVVPLPSTAAIERMLERYIPAN
jgi:hypothetical protein